MQGGNITVQIMAGGHSRRMGRDKALLPLGGRTLLEWALAPWKGYPLQLSVGRNALTAEGVKTVVDLYSGCGPLGGLHAGLLACETEFLLLRAVDTPFLTSAMADILVSSIGGADACVFTLKGLPEPLFGLYRKAACLPIVEEMLQAGERKMGLLLRRVNTVFVPWEDEKPFRNLNTPQELREAEEALSKA